MKEKDLFKLAVRILGLIFLYHAISGLPPLITAALIFLRRWRWETFAGAFGAVLWCGWMLALAYWFVRGAPLLVAIAYDDGDKSFPAELPGGEKKPS